LNIETVFRGIVGTRVASRVIQMPLANLSRPVGCIAQCFGDRDKRMIKPFVPIRNPQLRIRSILTGNEVSQMEPSRIHSGHDRCASR
jgi:hypothetical protein